MTNRQLVPTVQASVDQYNEMVQFVQSILKEGLDYGIIPGTPKPTLFKPGAEKLCKHFGLTPRFTEVQVQEDWTGSGHSGEPFFYYKIKCELSHGEDYVAECIASCNSWEERYRFRSANKVCPLCGKEAIIKGKLEYGGGWICFNKKGGCGTKFGDKDERITGQATDGKVPNPNIFDQVNTFVKQAQKRALVGATLIAVSASEFFTQDIEDMAIIQGEWKEVEPKSEPTRPTPARPAPQPEPDDHTGTEFDREKVEAWVEKTEFGIVYRSSGDNVMVKFGANWRPAHEQVQLAANVVDQSLALFTNQYEATKHLEKHFGVKIFNSLNWEQYLGLLNWKKKNIANPKWYADKAEVKPEPVVKVIEHRNELAALYDPLGKVGEAQMNEFLAVLNVLPDPRALLFLIESGLTVEKNWDDITNIAAIVASDPANYLGPDGTNPTSELQEYIDYAKNNNGH